LLQKLREIYQRILSNYEYLLEKYSYFPPFCTGEDTFVWLDYLRAKAEFAKTICEIANSVLKSLTFYLTEGGSICFHRTKGRRIQWTKYSLEEVLFPILKEAGFDPKVLSITPATRITRYRATQIKKLFKQILEQ